MVPSLGEHPTLEIHLARIYAERHGLGAHGATHHLRQHLADDDALRAAAERRLAELDALHELLEPHGGLSMRCTISDAHRHGLRSALGSVT